MIKRICLYILAACCLVPAVAGAQGIYEANTRVTLESNVEQVASGQAFWVAVRMRMEPGWHVYWRNPGDSGFPPKAEWILPEGFTVSDFQWPYPERIDYEGLTSYGYDGDLWLWALVTPPENVVMSDSIPVQANISWLACEKICIPGKAKASLTIPVAGATALKQENVDALERSRLLWPDRQHSVNVSAQADADTIRFRLNGSSIDASLTSLSFFPDRNDVVDHIQKQPWVIKDGDFLLDIPRSKIFETDEPFVSVQGVVVADKKLSENGRTSIYVDVPVETVGKLASLVPAEIIPKQTGSVSISVLTAFVFAFVGGLILNLMPCVLPVLSIKILQLIKHHEDPQKAWQSGIQYSIGVVGSFLILAAAMLVLKAGGQQIGWGFQFQSPYFVIGLLALFFVMAMNLFGVFEVGSSLTRVGGRPSKGAFLSGVLATVAATPCTAPFMGTAMGFALSQPAWVSLAVFGCIGLGMAVPFLILTRFPSLMKYLPKPGQWMVVFKMFMGFLLMAAVIWLVWVLGLQVTFETVIRVLAALVLTAMGLWFLGVVQRRQLRNLGLVRMASIIFLVFGLWLAFGFVRPSVAVSSVDAEGIAWQPYDPSIIEQLRSEGHLVVLDFTAAWCLSCQVNDRVVFQNPGVIRAFEEHGVKAVKADWTNHDPIITQALADLGKNSIPVYVVYNGQEGPIFLPEILTPGIMIKTLDNI